MFDQETHCEGNQEFTGPRFRRVERAFAFDGENGLFNLMREESAIACECRLNQEISAVHLCTLEDVCRLCGHHDTILNSGTGATMSGLRTP
jgi:hypothetical protein